MDGNLAKKFKGSFDALTKMGADYHNPQRFKPLIGDGKPLWEFKEFDHRLYCFRKVNDRSAEVVLLDGWVKDKEGKTAKEQREVGSAKGLLSEFLAGFPEGKI